MATATLLNPGPGYHQLSPYSYSQPPPPSHHPQPLPRPSPAAGSMLGMGPPSDTRIMASEKEPSQRQSLPSLSEVFSASKATSYSPKPAAINGVTTQAPPAPFHVAHARPETIPEARPPHSALDDKFFRFSQRPGSSSSSHPPGPPTYIEHRDMSKTVEPLRSEPSHVHAPAPPPALSGPRTSLSQPSQLPPGQYPLSQPAISPRHTGPFPTYETQGLPPSESDYTRGRYDPTTLNRHIETWSYQDCLNKVSARTTKIRRH